MIESKQAIIGLNNLTGYDVCLSKAIKYEIIPTAIKALEKQIPKKVVENCDGEVLHCPSCDYDLMGGVELDAEEAPEYCWKCGQHLDWSE